MAVPTSHKPAKDAMAEDDQLAEAFSAAMMSSTFFDHTSSTPRLSTVQQMENLITLIIRHRDSIALLLKTCKGLADFISELSAAAADVATVAIHLEERYAGSAETTLELAQAFSRYLNAQKRTLRLIARVSTLRDEIAGELPPTLKKQLLEISSLQRRWETLMPKCQRIEEAIQLLQHAKDRQSSASD